MFWGTLLLACCQLALASQVILDGADRGHQSSRLRSSSSSPFPATLFRLSSIYHRGLDARYRTHKRLDVDRAGLRTSAIEAFSQVYEVSTAGRGKVTRLRETGHDAIDSYQRDLRSSRAPFASDASLLGGADRWVEREIGLPNVTDRSVILTLAAMTSNAYTAIPHTGEWIDVDDGYNSTGPFGWDSNGLRGHVFANPDNSSVVIAYKGTSLTGPTAGRDKRSDNLMFSCCCGRISYLWRTVCDCYEETFTCNMTCLEKELRSPKGYYRAGLDIYHNVTHQYPGAEIWLVGHSLGGAVASLVAQTYGLPAVTFQAPGEKLAANRLGLPIVPKTSAGRNDTGSDAGFAKNIWAFGHTADPIYMGSCGGITSLCWSGGYAMETHCHSGLECVYDVVSDFGWRQGVNTHRIINVINDVILKYNDTPKAERSDECVDCFNWNT